MTSPRERKKARRRAEKTMDAAFEALLADRLPLAEKLARRAIAGSGMNARLWLDLGRVLWRCELLDEAEGALRHAIALSPDYGEAFGELAAFQAAAGKWPQAERLQLRAVELRPGDAQAAAKLASYAAMARPVAEVAGPEEPVPPPAWTERTARFAWSNVAAELRARGASRLPSLLSSGECGLLRDLWDQNCFEYGATSVDSGRFEWRYFAQPLPPLVQELREELYARLAPIADDWQRLLERRSRFAPTLAGFLRACGAAAQRRPSPALLRFPPGGHRTPQQDGVLPVVFPFRLEVPLGPAGSAETGGALRLLDVRSSKKHRQRTFAGEPGDGIAFAVPERLVEIAGVTAVQPVQYGTGECKAEHLVLSVPFHDVG